MRAAPMEGRTSKSSSYVISLGTLSSATLHLFSVLEESTFSSLTERLFSAQARAFGPQKAGFFGKRKTRFFFPLRVKSTSLEDDNTARCLPSIRPPGESDASFLGKRSLVHNLNKSHNKGTGASVLIARGSVWDALTRKPAEAMASFKKGSGGQTHLKVFDMTDDCIKRGQSGSSSAKVRSSARHRSAAARLSIFLLPSAPGLKLDAIDLTNAGS
mmetsp:Transcript_29538/g.71856  ORF Transcript_29538/g.71856 Transcript_29538/m.71856 type:complete len:215 (-) Transcript_29538:13-657(-)